MGGRVEVWKYPVSASPPSPENRKKLLRRLDVMNRELAHAQMAVSQLRNALQHPQHPGSTLAEGLLNSRNWVLSLLISHAFIQMVLDGDTPYSSIHTIQTRMMAREAVQEGIEQAIQEHIKDIHRTP